LRSLEGAVGGACLLMHKQLYHLAFNSVKHEVLQNSPNNYDIIDNKFLREYGVSIPDIFMVVILMCI
jgi:hypothetical protein